MRHLLLLLAACFCLLLAACLPLPAAEPTPAVITVVATVTVAPQPQSTPPAPVGPILSDAEIIAATLRPDAQMAPKQTDDLTRYQIALDVAPDFSRITGRAEVRYTNREDAPLDVVYFHLFPNLWDGGMAVTDVTADGQPVETTLPSGDDVLGVALPAPLQPGETVDFAMNFAMDIPSGDGVGNYGEFALQEKILALAHFYPTVMVYDDDWRLETPSSQGDVIYHDASLYDVTLTAPADLTVAATGATLDKTDLGDGRAEWRLAGGPMRDFNIVASSAYASEARQVDGVQVTSYFLPEDQEGGRLALDYAAKALEVFEDAFGPYPYRELEVAATATEAGGIEYPGLVVIARRLYDPNDRSGFFQAATAHEVAHQWWYNVVGNDQVNVPWLDEAMAQYATYLYYGAAYGPDGSQGFAKSLDDRWARVDYEKIPVGLPVEQYEDREYGAIVYGRGPLFLLALRDQIGEDKMSELVRRYYAENRWEIATPERFQALAEEVAGQDLDALFEEWVYGAKP